MDILDYLNFLVFQILVVDVLEPHLEPLPLICVVAVDSILKPQILGQAALWQINKWMNEKLTPHLKSKGEDFTLQFMLQKTIFSAD